MPRTLPRPERPSPRSLPALAALLAVAAPQALAACGEAPARAQPLGLVAVTFNVGTTAGLGHDSGPEDGYGAAQAALSDAYYGDGLAWSPAVAAAQAFFAALSPELVALQEVFYAGDCPAVPAAARPGFFCASWRPGAPTVANVVLGPDYQVACNLGKPDKCLAVHRRFGTFRGCGGALCLDHLDGARVEGCGGGSRVGRGVLDLVGGGSLTVVGLHGTSGFAAEDVACREAQFEQVFVSLGGGPPAANGGANVVQGDLNVDPVLLAGVDASARRWLDFVGPQRRFAFVSDAGEDAPRSYAGLFNIDHVVSDAFAGSCWVAGLTPGRPAVSGATYFDHRPVVCALRGPQP